MSLTVIGVPSDQIDHGRSVTVNTLLFDVVMSHKSPVNCHHDPIKMHHLKSRC